jgi:hypothetical protein
MTPPEGPSSSLPELSGASAQQQGQWMGIGSPRPRRLSAGREGPKKHFVFFGLAMDYRGHPLVTLVTMH